MNWLTSLLDRFGSGDRRSGDEPALQQALGPRYRLREELGRGGMAVVFLADDVRHGRQVAIKILRREPGGADTERFVREIKITARLQHPNIVPLLDSGEAGGLPYFVMPRVLGETLRETIKARGRLDPAEATGLAAAIAAALEYAHRQGIVHRDIKPSNILLSEGAPMVADFGIARALLAIEGEALTATGTAVGTPAYMSPEVLRGDPPDGRSDLYSLGCVLFETLTGELPFGGNAESQVWSRLSSPARRVRALRPELPEWLDGLVARLLRADPAERFQTASELEAALRGAAPVSDERPPVPEQEIRFCTTADGTTLAYAVSGSGRPLVKAANWLSHLEHDWTNPVWRHWLTGLARRYRLVRYDERGCGLSERAPAELSFESFVTDLEAVVAANDLERFPLLGISQGAAIAIAYAVRHPDRVSRLVLHGGYARGRMIRAKTDEARREAEALREIVRIGWGQENPAFRQIFTTLFYPDAPADAARSFTEMQAVSSSPDDAVRIIESTDWIDVQDLARQVRVPTLVLHCRNEVRVPFEEGRLLASLIPDARLVSLPSSNHIPLEHETAWTDFLDAVTRFLDEDE